jgi:WD40 repeat protein
MENKMQSFKFTPVLVVAFFLAACAPSPTSPTPEVDMSALSTHAVATVYADLTAAPPTATAQPPLLIRALPAAHLTELAWSPDGQAIVAAACQETCQINLYNLELSPVWSVEVAGTVSYLEYSPDGKLIAALVKNGVQSRDENGKILEAAQTEIWLFNAQDGAFLRKWDVEQAVTLKFNPLGTHIATAGGSVILWEIATGQVRWRLKPNERSYNIKYLLPEPIRGPLCLLETFDSVSFNLDGTILIYSGEGLGVPNEVEVTSVSELRKCSSMKFLALGSGGAYPSDVNFMAFGSEQIPAPKKLALQITSVFSDDKTFVSSLLVMDSGFYPYNLYFLPRQSNLPKSFGPQEKPAETWGLDFSKLTVSGAAISPSAERAAVWGKTPDNPPAYFLNLFDARTAQQIAQVRMESDPALGTFSAAFSPDGRLLASTDRGGALSLWRVSHLQP